MLGITVSEGCYGGVTMKKCFNFSLLLFPVIALVLEILPRGVVMMFRGEDGAAFFEYFSYFHTFPIAYGNIGPFLTGILSVILLILAIMHLFVRHKGVRKAIRGISIAAVIAALLPLMGGIRQFSWINGIVVVVLFLEFWASFLLSDL